MNLKKKVYSILDSIRICFKCASLETCICIILSLIHSLLPAFLVQFNSEFINSVLKYYQKQGDIHQIVITTIKLSIVFFMTFFHVVIMRLLNEHIAIHLRNKFNPMIVNKCINLKYEYIEDGETCDLINRILRYPGLDVLQTTFQNLLRAMEIVIQVILIGVLMIKQVWWMIPVIFISMIPLVIIAVLSSREKYEVVRWNSELARKSNYVEFDVLRSRNSASERSLFGYSKHYNDRFEEYFIKSVKKEREVIIKWLVRIQLSGVLVTAVIFLIGFALFGHLRASEISLGFFISIVQSLFSLENILVNDVRNTIAQLVEEQEYFKDITKFSGLDEESKEKIEDSAETEIETIEFKDVYFKYPGTERYILNGVSFKIDKGKHYAIVGKNGSGKTTITKLLLRLYKIDSGEILINGKNIYDYSTEKIHSMFSVVYQDYAKYAITVRENIGIGNLKNYTQEKIEKVVDGLGLKEVIEKLPNGYDTPLGKVLENGVDLSGGQWQRVALARTLIRENAVKILDEPTAALDPIQETELYRNYGKIAKDSTTVFISHRLGSTKLADTILLIDDGKVLSSGSHEELMNQYGLYREMFCKQKEWYSEE